LAIVTAGRKLVIRIIGQYENRQRLILCSDKLDNLVSRPGPLDAEDVDASANFGEASKNGFHQGAMQSKRVPGSAGSAKSGLMMMSVYRFMISLPM
jgi:hypothetical protein